MLPFWKLGKTNMYHPFEFPFSGKTEVVPTPNAPQSIPTDGSLDLINIPAGQSGVVREIQIISETNSGVQDIFKNLIINFKINGESSPSSSLPVASMVGWELGIPITAPYETPFWTITNPINVGESYYPQFNLDGANEGLVLTYPIPYTNGIHIYLTKTNYSLGPDSFWNNVTYQNNLPAVWNRDYKFHAVRSDELLTPPSDGAGTISISGNNVTGIGTNFQASDVGKYLLLDIQDHLITSYTDATHITIGSKNTPGTGSGLSYKITAGHTFLTRPAGTSGYLASVVMGLDGVSGATHLETNPRLRFNQETDNDSVTFTGGEDFLKQAFYFDSKSQSARGGVTCFDQPNGRYTGYSIFYFNPLKYINGMSGHFPSVNTQNTQCNFTSVYYEEQ